MAEGKKSVLLYCDIIHTVEELDDAEAGRLFKHYLRYINDKNPEPPDKLTKIVFEPIKQQLKRDLIKWEDVKEIKSAAGHIGGVKSGEARRKQKEANEACASNSKQTEANEAVTATAKDTVTVKVNNILPGAEIFNVEDFFLKNEKHFESACMAANCSDKKIALSVLHKFHLYLESNDKYPQSKKRVIPGFEKFLINEEKFIKNGTHQRTPAGVRVNPKSAGAIDLLNSLKRDISEAGGTGQADY